jgi:uncharacterized protein YyaL (SSP411 family)
VDRRGYRRWRRSWERLRNASAKPGEGAERKAVRRDEFLFAALVKDGRLMRTYKEGVAKIPGFLEDQAAFALAAVALHNLTFDQRWLDRAISLADEIVARFWDDDTQACFDTASDGETLVTHPRDVTVVDPRRWAGHGLQCPARGPRRVNADGVRLSQEHV